MGDGRSHGDPPPAGIPFPAMETFRDLLDDLRALRDAIDGERPLAEIRVAALRALTRNRFFTEEVPARRRPWRAPSRKCCGRRAIGNRG